MFTEKTLEFLYENHGRGDREWFVSHKNEYTEFVLRPLNELAETLAPTVKNIDPQLVTDPKAAVSRIYRDMRFAKGGSPYRETMWVSFRYDRKAYPGYPEFYFVFSPREFFYGCGYYCPKAASMEAVRRLIIESDKKFAAAAAVLENNGDFCIEGDMYKRSRHSEYPENLRNWLDRKTLCCSCRPDISRIFDADLSEQVRMVFMEMKPIYDFLMYAEKNLKMGDL